MKQVICMMIDSLMPDILEQCWEAKLTPALQFLRERGQYRNDCISAFPTMTASVDSSLLTGSYPDQHHVPGLIWYDAGNKEIINYINGAKCVWKLGAKRCLQNVLYHLNHDHLSSNVQTVYEELQDKGHTTASINMIIHRGRKTHSLQLADYWQRFTGFKKNSHINGPDVLHIGAVCYPDFVKKDVQHVPTGFKEAFGINDTYATQMAYSLIADGRQPDFMLVYMPENDHRIHQTTPEAGLQSLIEVDQHISTLLNAYPSWEDALQQNVWMIISDHGQTRIGTDKNEFNIPLEHILSSFRTVELGQRVEDEHEVVICNNERMCYVYPLKSMLQERIVQELARERRIDIIAWKENETVHVMEGGSKRRCQFRHGHAVTDEYGQRWEVEGDLGILDLMVNASQIEYGDYPDVLARLYGALFAQSEPVIVVNARPKYEFQCRHYPTHNNGGSHGSLHKWDSTVPILVAGDESGTPLPKRLVDWKSYVLHLFEKETTPARRSRSILWESTTH